MPDELRPSILRRITPSRIMAVGASVAVATGVAAFMVFAAASASGASAPQPGITTSAEAPKPASVQALIGLPAGVEIVDRQTIGAAVRFAQIASFGEALEQQPPLAAPPAASAAPVIAQAQPTVAAPQPTVSPAPTAVPEPPPSSPPPAPSVGVGLDTSPMDGYEQALFDATNVRRVSQGLAPLRANGYLVGVARIRSQDMATNNYFAHTSPVTGDTAFSLMDAYGVPYDWAGENLAMNNYPAAECVGVADQALWDSPPHRENILNPHYTDMGIGLRVSPDGMYYFTILFTGPV
jgi:uncharacterized protein YkwD